MYEMSMAMCSLTSPGFGVAAVGHRNPTVVGCTSPIEVLLHAMGDAFADPKRIELMEKLARSVD